VILGPAQSWGNRAPEALDWLLGFFPFPQVVAGVGGGI
jgi:hypothetical protein